MRKNIAIASSILITLMIVLFVTALAGDQYERNHLEYLRQQNKLLQRQNELLQDEVSQVKRIADLMEKMRK